MQKKDKILLTRINNLLGCAYTKFQDVNWYDFFVSIGYPSPDSVFNQQAVLLEVIPYLSKDGMRVDIMDSYIKAGSENLTDRDIDWVIAMVTDNFPHRFAKDYETKAVVQLLATLIDYCNVQDYHIDKILEPYKEDRHGFKNIILDSIIESGKLTKVLLETYIDDFTMDNWHAISKMNLWQMYSYDLFSPKCPIREFINYRLVLQNNPIPVPVVYSLFMGTNSVVRDVLDFNLPVFKFEDNWWFVFSHYQFSQDQISAILHRYKGTQHEHEIFWYILRCQYVDEITLNPFKYVIMNNPLLKEKYETIFIKDNFKNRRLKKKTDKALRSCLTAKGLEIQKDSFGEYVNAACIAINYDYFTDVEITKRYYRVLEQAPEVVINTAFTVPRTAYFVIGNDSNADQFKVYLENITMNRDEQSDKITLTANRILKI